jgi:O-antigen ligase/polysaccharide polymerase Wzy-like membrane protein
MPHYPVQRASRLRNAPPGSNFGRRLTARTSLEGFGFFAERSAGKRASFAAVPVLPAHVLLVVAALTAAVVAKGGYYGSGQPAIVLLIAAAAVAALRSRGWSRSDMRLAPILACAALAAWAVVSGASAGHLADAGPTVLLLAGVVTVFVVSRRTTPAQRDALAGALVAVGVLAAVTGWIGVAWRLEPWALEDGTWRAATTITYPNAAAGLLAPLALLSVARLVARPRSALAAAATCILLVGLGASQSRGGALALVAGAVVLAWLLGPRALVRVAAPPVLGAAIALAGLAPSFASGSPPRPELAAAALGAGLMIAVGARAVRGRAIRAAVLVGVCALAVSWGLDHGAPSIHSRLTLAPRGRGVEASDALHQAASRPLSGVGPGQATFTWQTSDGRTATVRYAHNEYLQVLAELGAVGLIALGAFFAALGRAVWRGRGSAPSPEAFAGIAAGLVALASHSGFDFLWHVPAVALAGALLAGLALTPSMTNDREEQS